MLAFAANSLLCRLALAQPSIDPASFGSIRLASGAATLALVLYLKSASAPRYSDWFAAAMLFAYVAFFSFAYLELTAGTGALILFGAVQLTMFAAGLSAGERFPAPAMGGLALAAGGLIYLVSPGLSAPPLFGALLMAAAGVAWGFYSLRGRRASDPLAATAGNFLRATPMALALSLLYGSHAHLDAMGTALAIASGAITSGLGYVIWYAALPGLGSMRAATVQLSVPPIAAFGGTLLLGEAPSLRLILCSLAILGGIAIVLATRARK
ncbi:MAG: DMT family transporter [Rhodocyclaceae bacterium]|nr:DMT family transporter [Rhodocyclaceae bacterium]MBX3669038.1 DMT family transporter [Rhodocyclaceae bacterium]